MLTYRLKKISVSSTLNASARETLAVITKAIPDEAEHARIERVGGRIVAEVPSTLPSVVIKRRLADAGIDAEVDTIVRFGR
jgi:hypothetical protein